MQQANDPVNHPSHYNRGGIEVLNVIKAYGSPNDTPYEAYCRGNAIKYLLRAPFKDKSIQDLNKMIFYVNEYKKSKGAE